jgi:hypothetical protein
MPLEQVYYLSQSVASIAVVCSLVYLALQVRQAERSQRAMMQQGRADRTSQASLAIATPELAAVWNRGGDGDPTMTPDEVAQFLLMCRAAFLSGEDSFLQHKLGTLDSSAFESYSAGVRAYLSRPGFRAAWRLSAPQFGKAFRDFGDAQIAAIPVAPDVDVYAEWKKALLSEARKSDA